MSTVRDNLMTIEGYSPYCGANGQCPLPRTHFDGKQFVCNHCGWRSGFPKDFIKEYKNKWEISDKHDKDCMIEINGICSCNVCGSRR